MKNNQLFPFERNRYYTGKMLTSSDFQAEQAYFNNKRRFINSMMYGSGIICGCNVFSLDDLSVLVESGAAIDGFGREIVVQDSVVKKLSAIEGFQELKGKEAFLCMRYQETPVHTVFAVNHREQGDSYEYNHISEGYELFLKDAKKETGGFELESGFFLQSCLYEGQDFQVELTMPATVCKGTFAKVHVELKKRSDNVLPVSWKGMLQMPSFLTEDGKHELQVGFEELVLSKGQAAEKDYWIEAEKTDEEETNLVFWDEKGNRSLKVQLWNGEPDELVTEEIAKTNLEMLGLEGKKDYVVLAKLTLLRTDSAYIIDEVKEHGIKKYIRAPGWEIKRRQYGSCFREIHNPLRKNGEKDREISQAPAKARAGRNMPLTSTGIVEIPLGANAKKGDICYSGEIMHGLGRGNVYVELGIECYGNETAPGANVKSTVYGSLDLFPKDTERLGHVETAVKVLNDKGSFLAAVRLLKNMDCFSLACRWVAILFPSGEETWEEEDYGSKSITAETPTVVLGLRESYYFNVIFHNMEKCSLAYELTESGSGDITADGVYTAPRKEGVYEIRIYCMDMPVICTYAYAVVRSKQGEGKERK